MAGVRAGMTALAKEQVQRVAWRTRRSLWKLCGTPVVHLLRIGKTGGSVVADAMLAHAAASPWVILREGLAEDFERVKHLLQLPHDAALSTDEVRALKPWPRGFQ